MLEYLSRYTHRTAIGNERIRAVTTEEVAFMVRADDRGGKRLHRLEGTEFVRRFMLHVLPTGVKRIRHYRVLATTWPQASMRVSIWGSLKPLSKPAPGCLFSPIRTTRRA